jgi:GNAT superfamily N-acetyltransferase
MTTERRAIGQSTDFTVRNEPLSSGKRAGLLEQDGTVHLSSPTGELILAHENGQQSVYWGFDSIDSMRKEFLAMWDEALISVERDEIDYISMNLSQVAARDMVLPILATASFKQFAEWIEMLHPDLPESPPVFSAGIEMRRAGEDDLDIFENIWSDSLGDLADGLATFDDFASRADWAGALTLNDEVIGFAFNGTSTSGDGQILTAAIAQNHWGKGYGRELLEAALYQLGTVDHRRAVIRVRPDVRQALKICSGLGMRHAAGGIEWRRSIDEEEINLELEARRKAGVKARFGGWR